MYVCTAGNSQNVSNLAIKCFCKMNFNDLKMLLLICPSFKVLRQQKHWITTLQLNESLRVVCFLQPGILLEDNIKPSKARKEAQALVGRLRFTVLSAADAASRQVMAQGAKSSTE